MATSGIPELLTRSQAERVLGLAPTVLKSYRARDKEDGGHRSPEPTVIKGGERPVLGYTWESLNAWLRARGKPEVVPHCPCCGRP